MLTVIRLFLIASPLLLLTSSTFSSTDTESAANPAHTIQQLRAMPLPFTANRGQWDSRVGFQAKAGGVTFWFGDDGASYQFTRTVTTDQAQVGPIDHGHLLNDPMSREQTEYESMTIRASFVGANPNPELIGADVMDYKCNYFIGNDPANWHTDVPNYRTVLFKQVYDGIDLKYYGNGTQMEYDFIVEPGADFSRIEMRYEGAELVAVNNDGDLIVRTEWGEVIDRSPNVYQMENGARVRISGKYSLRGSNTFGFELGEHNPDLPLVIDPVLIYSTYLGGSSFDGGGLTATSGASIVIDGEGNAYVTGETYSTDFPIEDGYQPSYGGGGRDAFVTKLNSAGNGLIYSTYLGGNSDDEIIDVEIDASGNAFVTGLTYSDNFPTESAYQTYQGEDDVFVTKLNAQGNALIYSTYLGGTNMDWGTGLEVDEAGAAYVTGVTWSDNFPTKGAYQGNRGGIDGFVTKLNAQGNDLVYSTYLGGSSADAALDIAVDQSGNAYVCGSSGSTDFPIYGQYQSYQGAGDAFLTKLNSTGNAVIFSTYLGGDAKDAAHAIVLSASGNACIMGETESSSFPFVGGFLTYQDSTDIFVTEFTVAGNDLVYSTYIGGAGSERCGSIALDNADCAYITGFTTSDDFPTVGEFQPELGTGCAFVTKINDSGTDIIYSTRFGASDSWELGNGVAVDELGNCYVTGYTLATNFPVVNPFQTNQGSVDVFVSKFSSTEIMISLDKTTLDFYASPNGSLPTYQSFTISNIGIGSLDWSVDEQIDWLDISPSEGTGNSQEITVSIITTALDEGTYSDTIHVNSTNALNSPQTIVVTYTLEYPEICLTRDSLGFQAVAGGTTPYYLTFTINNCGGSILEWTFDEEIPWLDLTVWQRTENQAIVTATVNTTDLGIGTYCDTIMISSTNADNGPIPVRVDYTITPSYGTTVIIHGLIPTTTTAAELDDSGEWVLNLGNAIIERLGSGWLWKIEHGFISSPWPPLEQRGVGEQVIAFSWIPESDIPIKGFAEAAADALFAKLVEGAQLGLWKLDQLHFIAHSRGAIVASETIQRLGLYSQQLAPLSVDNAIHLTTLDSHPWDWRTDCIGDPCSAADEDVNDGCSFIENLDGDYTKAVVAWNNIGFFDNYFQGDCWNPDGVLNGLSGDRLYSVASLASYSLTFVLGVPDLALNNTHSKVHTWYYGTINTECAILSYDSCYYDELLHWPVDDWYAINEVNVRETIGFNYSRNFNVEGASILAPTNKVPVQEDNNLFKGSIFNGDFSMNAVVHPVVCLLPLILDPKKDPGWSYQGGTGGMDIDGIRDKRLVLREGYERADHNLVYIPSNATHLNLSYEVNNRDWLGSLDYFFVLIDDQIVGNPLPLNHYYKRDWMPIPISDTDYPGTVRTISLYVRNYNNDDLGAKIKIDDVHFILNNNERPEYINKGYFTTLPTTFTGDYKLAASIARSPIDLIITDPDGLIISKDTSYIPGATYDYSVSDEGDSSVYINIPFMKDGVYDVQPVPGDSTDPTDVFSLYGYSSGSSYTLAEDISVADIPAEGYELCNDADTSNGDLCCCGRFTAGYTGNADCDPEGKMNLADVTKLIDRVYLSKASLCCESNGNVDGDSENKMNLADITKLVDHIYLSKEETAACP